MSRATVSETRPLKFYQIMVGRADGTRYSSIRSEPFGDEMIEIFGINSSASQIEKIKLFKVWMMLAQLAPAMPSCIPNADGQLQDRYEQLTAPFDVIFRALIFQGLPAALVKNDRFFQAANFSAAKIRPSIFSNNENAAFQDDLSQVLLDAALNADLAIVKTILENVTSDQCKKLLSRAGTASTHLGCVTVDRTGTPLQMAIYDHDEEMVGYLKEKMDSEEFDRQSKEAFKKAVSSENCAKLDCRNAEVLEYHQSMLEQQEGDAEKLCARLEDAFKAAQPSEFTVDRKYVASTTSQQLPQVIDAFVARLIDCVKKNPVYNPFILRRVYDIYSHLSSNFEHDCYFSQKVIGGVQSFLSVRWLQHYAQGIYYLSQSNESPQRSFICRDSNPQIDVRHLVSSCVGVDSFLGVHSFRAGCCRSSGGWCFENYLEQKQQAIRHLFRSESNRLSA